MNTDFVHPKDAPKLQAAAQQDFLKADAALKVRVFENAVVSPFNQNGDIYVDKALLSAAGNGFVVPPQSYVDETVVYVGSFIASWGHEITDNLKRLWFYFDKRFSDLKKLKFVFTSARHIRNELPSDNFWALLKSLGIPKTQFHLVETPTRFARVFLPEDCFFLIQIRRLFATPRNI